MMRSAHLMLGLEGNKDPDLPDEERNMRSIVVLENRMSGETGRIPLFYDKQCAMQPQIIKSTAETAAGIGLLFTPYWSQLLTDIGFAASIMAQ
ncbi:MAG: hypothetical protein Dbin4_00724, partial [Alphaproteobacteria bacterium]|nr:hypothetical protein [Alphaproteobacteria bacterium]